MKVRRFLALSSASGSASAAADEFESVREHSPLSLAQKLREFISAGEDAAKKHLTPFKSIITSEEVLDELSNLELDSLNKLLRKLGQPSFTEIFFQANYKHYIRYDKFYSLGHKDLAADKSPSSDFKKSKAYRVSDILQAAREAVEKIEQTPWETRRGLVQYAGFFDIAADRISAKSFSPEGFEKEISKPAERRPRVHRVKKTSLELLLETPVLMPKQVSGEKPEALLPELRKLEPSIMLLTERGGFCTSARS